MKKALVVLKVVVTAAPTYLAVVVLVAPQVADYVAEVLPSPWSDRVVAVVLTFAGVAASTLALIRRVEPVVASRRGLLPEGEVITTSSQGPKQASIAVRSDTSFPYNVGGERGRIEVGFNLVSPAVYEVLVEGGMVEPI